MTLGKTFSWQKDQQFCMLQYLQNWVCCLLICGFFPQNSTPARFCYVFLLYCKSHKKIVGFANENCMSIYELQQHLACNLTKQQQQNQDYSRSLFRLLRQVTCPQLANQGSVLCHRDCYPKVNRLQSTTKQFINAQCSSI